MGRPKKITTDLELIEAEEIIRPELDITNLKAARTGSLGLLLKEFLRREVTMESPISGNTETLDVATSIILILLKKALINGDLRAIETIFELSGATGKNRIEETLPEDSKKVDFGKLSTDDLKLLSDILNRASSE